MPADQGTLEERASQSVIQDSSWRGPQELDLLHDQMSEMGIPESATRQRFEEAASRITRWNGPAVKAADQLVLYGLYKQASMGDCRSQRPGVFDPTGRAKWTSWKSVGGLHRLQAMQRYCTVADDVCPPPPQTASAKEESLDPASGPLPENSKEVDRDRAYAVSGGKAGAAVSRSGTDAQSPCGTLSTPVAPRPSGADRSALGEGRVEDNAEDKGLGDNEATGRLRQEGAQPGGKRRGGFPQTIRSKVIPAAATFAVLVVLAGSTLLRRGGQYSHGEEERVLHGNGKSRDSRHGGPLWWVSWSVGMYLPGFVSLALLALIAGGCFWFAVRLARWREEIFAGSPIVSEALMRAAALGEDRRPPGMRSAADAGGLPGVGGGRDGASGEEMADPIGNIFRPGSAASRDFDCSRTAAATRGDNGAVVFLTGVTGLVGQMVLFDLLRQGAAIAEASAGQAKRGRGVEQGGDAAADDGVDNTEAASTKGASSRGLERVIVLVRGKKRVSPSRRLAEISNSPMFRALRESGAWADEDSGASTSLPSERGSASVRSRNDLFCEDVKEPGASPPIALPSEGYNDKTGRGATVTVVEGELGTEGLGLTAESRALLSAAGVTHSLHCAASVSFSDPLAEAAATNVTGALRVAALVASWPTCGTLVHVSTAFVHGGNSGTPSSPLPQQLPDFKGRDPARLFRSAQNAPANGKPLPVGVGSGPGQEAIQAMRELGYPNTYAFTKALGEHLMVRALRAHNRKVTRMASEGVRDGAEAAAASTEDEEQAEDGRALPCRLSLRVVRPSIVGPSWVFPWPGWTGEQPSTVTGCQVLGLQRAAKAFRLGPHPAPIIPVDVVSRAIVHSALGWGGPLMQSAEQVSQLPSDEGAISDCSVTGLDTSGASDLGELKVIRSPQDTTVTVARGDEAASGDTGGAESGSRAEYDPEVRIRNLAWATHRVSSGSAYATIQRNATNGSGSGDTTTADGGTTGGTAGELNRHIGGATGSGEFEGEGRMPSFQEISAFLYDYAVLRGLRPAFEAMAMRGCLMITSLSRPSPFIRPGSTSDLTSSDFLGRPQSSVLQEAVRMLVGEDPVPGQSGSRSRAFEIMNMLINRSPVWALQGIVLVVNGLRFWKPDGGGTRGRRTRKGKGGTVASLVRRLDLLAGLPAVYEEFTSRQFFFESALRAPPALTPEGYALETALASELLQRSLPGGSERGVKASPTRRSAILAELSLQIQTHRAGGLRCGRDTTFCIKNVDAVHFHPERSAGTCVAEDTEYTPLLGEHKKEGPLSFLSRRGDRLRPWPALAWWAATLPGSATRGGVTLWVRFVAFAVRTVTCRITSVIAVDVDSFRAAAPPGYGIPEGGGACTWRGHGSVGRMVDEGDCDGGRRRWSRRSGEIKEDGMLLDVGTRAGDDAARSDDAARTGGGMDKQGESSGQRENKLGNDEKDAAAAAAAAAALANGDVRGDKRNPRSGETAPGGRCSYGDCGNERETRGRDTVVVLLPTHRSYLDFVLVSLMCAAMRSLPGMWWLRVPKVAAADGPFGKEGSPLRWLLEKLGAFFVHRNKGESHSALRDRLQLLRQDHGRPLDRSLESSTRPAATSADHNITAHVNVDEPVGDCCGRPGDATIEGDVRGNGKCQAEAVGRSGGGSRGWPDPCQSDSRQEGLETFEVFLEGTRSRDRRFLAPKTGLLRALQAAREGARLWLVPVSISYERVPEQAQLAEELLSVGGGRPPVGAGLSALIRWTAKALCGRVRLGKILMRAGDPVALNPGGDVRAAVQEVRSRQRSNTAITPYHLAEASKHFGLPVEDICTCVRLQGGTVWEDGSCEDDETNPFASPSNTLPSGVGRSARYYPGGGLGGGGLASAAAAYPAANDTESWMLHLQWLHLFEKEGLRGRLSRWSEWLVPTPPLPSSSSASSSSVGSAGGRESTRDKSEGPQTMLPPCDEALHPSAVVDPISETSGNANPAKNRITRDDGPAGTVLAEAGVDASSSSESGRSSARSSSASWVMDAGLSPTSEDRIPLSDDEMVLSESSSTTNAASVTVRDCDASQRVLTAVLREFDRSEKAVIEARQVLEGRGFNQPDPGHVLQALRNAREECKEAVASVSEGGPDNEEVVGQTHAASASGSWPSLFLANAAFSHLHREHPQRTQREGTSANASVTAGEECTGGSNGTRKTETISRAEEAAGDDGDWFGAEDGDAEAVGSWGFRDSGFCVASDKVDGKDPYVIMRGTRYGICGQPLRGLLPFVREAVGVPISTEGRVCRAVCPPPPALPPSRLLEPSAKCGSDDAGSGTGAAARDETLLKSMVEALGPEFDAKEQVSMSRQERARHGAGHGLSDIWALRSLTLKRAPDGVVWPASEDQVSRLMDWAGREGVCLIPFGGGTSVTRALEVPPLNIEPRPVLSVDMRKLCRVLDVDVENGTAHIEAGMVGRHLKEELAGRGVTMGHEPDSLEFSTVGGWVATRASGMKRGRYGNVEDMVLEVRVVTGKGVAWQHSDRAGAKEVEVTAAAPFSRTSVGLDLASAMLGSEGCLGIITSVVVKIVPLPDVSEHASFLFQDFQTGVAFCRDLSASSGRLGLASCRLLDNRQMRLGKALKGEQGADRRGIIGAVTKLVPMAQMAYIQLVKGWDMKETSAVTLVFEGSKREAAMQRKSVSKIARAHGGISGGASAGKSGYDLTFAIAYLRDFALLFDVLGESFETFVAWTALEGLCERVRGRVRKEHRKRGLRGDAFVTHRVTQLYSEGACVYFYLAIYAEGVSNAASVFSELEESARDEILLAGGSLSHHHGIGKARAGFASRVSSPVVTELLLGMKRALDPHNVLGARNNLLATSTTS